VAESIVKRHLANAYEKMGVHSRSGAVDAALRSGLLSSEEVWGGRYYPRYRCEAPGCGCEMIVVRPRLSRPGGGPGVPRQGDGAGLRRAMVADGGVYPPTRDE
jgi:hypothetical protein